jgi:hypothetical protein
MEEIIDTETEFKLALLDVVLESFSFPLAYLDVDENGYLDNDENDIDI